MGVAQKPGVRIRQHASEVLPRVSHQYRAKEVPNLCEATAQDKAVRTGRNMIARALVINVVALMVGGSENLQPWVLRRGVAIGKVVRRQTMLWQICR